MSGSWEILPQAGFLLCRARRHAWIDRAPLCATDRRPRLGGDWQPECTHDVRGLLALSSCSGLTRNLSGFGQFHSAVIPHSDRVLPLINPNLERLIWHSQLPLPPNLWRGQKGKTRPNTCAPHHRNSTKQLMEPPPPEAHPHNPPLPPPPPNPNPF